MKLGSLISEVYHNTIFTIRLCRKCQSNCWQVFRSTMSVSYSSETKRSSPLPPMNTQKDRVRFRHGQKAWRVLCVCTSPTFSHWPSLNLAVFCETLNKTDGDYYRDETADGNTANHPKASLMKFTSFSRTMYRLVVLVKQCSCFVVRLHNNPLLKTCGRPTARTSIRLITAFGEWCRNESTTRHHSSGGSRHGVGWA